MTSRFIATRSLSCALLAILVLLVATPDARAAAKNYCRKIELTGSAGAGPNKAVEFLVKNNTGATLLNKSCPITAGANEPDIEYIKRLPYAWGTDSSNPPTTCPSPGGYDPLDPLKSQCVDYAGGSCVIKSKVAPKTTGAKKKYAEVCCYAEAGCSGTKLGTGADLTPVPITIQVEKLGSTNACPDPNNCEDCELCQVDPDPVGMQSLPSPSGARCRSSLAGTIGAYVNASTQVMVQCHKARMAGKIDQLTDCNDIIEADEKQTAAFARDAFFAAADACAATIPARSASAFGYRTCPAPCDGIDLGGCTAGNGAIVCDTDRDCDTAPGTGDGRCGDWSQAGLCLACVTDQAVGGAIQDKYGTPSVSMSAEAQQCQNAIGAVLAKLSGTRIGLMLACQKKRDGGKQPLGAGGTCKDNDPAGLIAAAEQSARDYLTGKCDASTIAELDSICSGATTAPALGQCMVDNVRSVVDAFSFAVVPSSAQKCGDNDQTGFEQCDGTDDADCPGSCTPQCLCGMLSPVTEDLTPCEPSVTDRYVFQVNAGQNVHVSADTVDAPTASDLCFDIGSGCDTGDDIQGDDDFPCTFPAPGSPGCPSDTFVASDDGVCTIEVTECTGNCANPALGRYQLNVTRNGNPAPVALINDDQP